MQTYTLGVRRFGLWLRKLVMVSFRSSLRGFSATCLVVAYLWLPLLPSYGQDANTPSVVESAEEKKERITADRFLQLLKRRPRLGTALDKIYGYHVGRGSLDPFCESLEAQAEEGRDGNIWLILGMVANAAWAGCQGRRFTPKSRTTLAEATAGKLLLGQDPRSAGRSRSKRPNAMKRAIERKPARPDMLAVFQDLGRIYQRTGRNDEALDVWKQLEGLVSG